MKFCIHLFFSFLFLFGLNSHGQKVGVVLSGGGASGLTHIGFLKALEENNIPIDYITGTSMGALIGALYASGYSPAQMELFAVSENFKNAAQGKIEDKYIYYFKKHEADASWISFKFSPDTVIEASIPTNLVSPIAIDLSLLEMLSPAGASVNNNFDSLMIPFRCVASDITDKKPVIFHNGNLTEAVRASMAYPFYLRPVLSNGHLYFDGGLYNNFPIDIMASQFKPDVILGNNVSSKITPPDQENIISQIKSMIVNRGAELYKYKNSVIIEPPASEIPLFEFNNIKPIIDLGYRSTIEKLDSIRSLIKTRTDSSALALKRSQLLSTRPDLVFKEIEITGLKKKQAWYVQKSLRKKSDTISISELKPKYFRLAADEKLRHIYPTTTFNRSTGYYKLSLDVRREKPMKASFGGNFSSKPINHAFVSIQYDYLGRFAASTIVNSYYGKLYSSFHSAIRFDFPTKYQVYLEPEVTLNRWDFFKTYATFFEDSLPSYLIQNDKYAGLSLGIPANNKGRIKAGFVAARMRDDYYLVPSFTLNDTADKTTFELLSPYILYERNTLNRKQYASSGTYLALKARYVQGNETNVPGSTSEIKGPFIRFHSWINVKLTYENYYKRRGHLRLGYFLEGVYSNQPFFNNYTATILAAPAFRPIPESRTMFLDNFRAHSYYAGGIKNVYDFNNNFDLRVEGYVFMPYKQIRITPDQRAEYGVSFSRRFYMLSSALVYHSPVGPLSLSLNYYDRRNPSYSVILNFGYLIFNKRALD